jgi:hypothetical protein
VTITAFALGHYGGHIGFTMSLTNASRARVNQSKWDVPSLKEFQNLASFCQNQENHNFRLYGETVAILLGS